MIPILSRARYKNPRLPYYLRNLSRLAVPRPIYRAGLAAALGRRSHGAEWEEVCRRVALAYRRVGPFELGSHARIPGPELLRKQRNYAFDLLRYTRRFPGGLRMAFRFGDETTDPGTPTLVKARSIAEPTGNSVVFPLNMVRHFVFVRDPLPFECKRDALVWRGAAQRPWRQDFLRRHFGRPGYDVGCTDCRPENAAWRRPFLGIGEQLRFKFVLSIEGNDVATNLKWILSSNSLCFMTPPRRESWFLEGQLAPGVHYVPLRDDYADLDEQVARYRRDTAAANRILKAAQAHVARFMDKDREDLVALLVLLRYFRDSGQWVDGLPGGDLAAELESADLDCGGLLQSPAAQ